MLSSEQELYEVIRETIQHFAGWPDYMVHVLTHRIVQNLWPFLQKETPVNEIHRGTRG